MNFFAHAIILELNISLCTFTKHTPDFHD